MVMTPQRLLGQGRLRGGRRLSYLLAGGRELVLTRMSDGVGTPAKTGASYNAATASC